MLLMKRGRREKGRPVSDSAARHRVTFDVRSYDVGEDHRLRLVVLNRMLQEAAWQHARLLGKGFIERAAGGYYWVLARLKLTIEELPTWGDRFAIETRPVGTDRMFALREFTIVDDADREIGYATSGWLVVDAARRRPVRPQPLVADLQISAPRYAFPVAKLESPENAAFYGPFPVRLHDIDQYRHVNNTAYLEWMLDCLADLRDNPEITASQEPPVELRMDFLQEAILSDRYTIGVESSTDRVRGEVTRVRDGQTCCRCELVRTGQG